MTYFSDINSIRKTKVDSVMESKKRELPTRNICQAIQTSNLPRFSYSPTLLRSTVALIKLRETSWKFLKVVVTQSQYCLKKYKKKRDSYLVLYYNWSFFDWTSKTEVDFAPLLNIRVSVSYWWWLTWRAANILTIISPVNSPLLGFFIQISTDCLPAEAWRETNAWIRRQYRLGDVTKQVHKKSIKKLKRVTRVSGLRKGWEERDKGQTRRHSWTTENRKARSRLKMWYSVYRGGVGSNILNKRRSVSSDFLTVRSELNWNSKKFKAKFHQILIINITCPNLLHSNFFPLIPLHEFFKDLT